jgi:hypothetical protein
MPASSSCDRVLFLECLGGSALDEVVDQVLGEKHSRAAQFRVSDATEFALCHESAHGCAVTL